VPLRSGAVEHRVASHEFVNQVSADQTSNQLIHGSFIQSDLVNAAPVHTDIDGVSNPTERTCVR